MSPVPQLAAWSREGDLALTEVAGRWRRRFTGAQQVRVLAAHAQHIAFAPAPDVRVHHQDARRAARDVSRLIQRGVHRR